MASITSQKEQDAIEALGITRAGGAYIGGRLVETKSNGDHIYSWTDGSTFYYENWATQDGEPDGKAVMRVRQEAKSYEWGANPGTATAPAVYQCCLPVPCKK